MPTRSLLLNSKLHLLNCLPQRMLKRPKDFGGLLAIALILGTMAVKGCLLSGWVLFGL
jgi:hypothetical protein